jgi:hypothetical protein
MYTFIITKPGAKTSAYVTDMQMYNLEGLYDYIRENMNERYGWHDPMIRVGRVNDEEFGVKSTKNLSIEEFEEIFQPQKNYLPDLLKYYPNEQYGVNRKYPIFKKEVYKKYGIEQSK